MIDFNMIPSPCYVMEEELLRRNLSLIKSVKERAGVNVILAFKAFAMWKAFPIVREYIPYSTASSKFEARLAFEEMGSRAHTYSPAYTEADFPEILRYSSHVTFNSLTQFERFYPMVQADGNRVSCGLRINPEYSDVETDLYNPCAPGSRMGVVSDLLDGLLPDGVEGLHFHTLCESSSYDLEKTLGEVEKRFGRFLPHIKWLNMGGGHLMTRKGYDTEHLILGTRLHDWSKYNQKVVEACARYCDVVSVNYYGRWQPETDFLANLKAWCAVKPFLVSEFYTKAEDASYKGVEYANTEGGGWLVHAQKNRGEFHQNFCLRLLETRNCIGWIHFEYNDSYASDGSASNKGIVSLEYEPYESFLSYVRQLNLAVYPLIDYYDTRQ